MNMKTNQNGFSAIEALLIVIILGLVGFTGWFVWHSRRATDTPTDRHTITAAAQPDPLQHKTYRNTTLGFELSYPQLWGQPKLEAGGDPGGKTYTLFIGHFSGSITPRDYVVPANATGSVMPQFTYDGCKSFVPAGSDATVVTLYSTDDICVIVVGQQTAVGVATNFDIQKKFSAQAKLPGLELIGQGATATAQTASAIKEANFGTSQELIDLAQSIKEVD